MGRFEQIYEEHREALRVFVQRRAVLAQARADTG